MTRGLVVYGGKAGGKADPLKRWLAHPRDRQLTGSNAATMKGGKKVDAVTKKKGTRAHSAVEKALLGDFKKGRKLLEHHA